MNILIDKLCQKAYKVLTVNCTEMGLSVQANSSSAALELFTFHGTRLITRVSTAPATVSYRSFGD